MAECIERTFLERECGGVRRNDPALLGKAVREDALARDPQGREWDVYDYNLATRKLRKKEAWPSGSGTRVKELDSRAKLEQAGDLLCFTARGPAGTTVVAAANAAFQISHRAGTRELNRLRQAARQFVQFSRKRHDPRVKRTRKLATLFSHLTNQADWRVPAGAAGHPPDTRPVERVVRRHRGYRLPLATNISTDNR